MKKTTILLYVLSGLVVIIMVVAIVKSSSSKSNPIPPLRTETVATTPMNDEFEGGAIYDGKSGDYNVLFHHDFDDLGFLGRGAYDPNNDPGWNLPAFDYVRPLSTMAIVNDGTGNAVFAHYYDQGHSGDQPKNDYPTFEYATGTYFSTYIRADREGFDDLYMSWNMKTSPGFVVGQKDHVYAEMKMSGLLTSNFTGPGGAGASVRLRHSNWDSGLHYIRWMLKTALGQIEPMVGGFNDTIDTRGVWHNYCMRVSNNTGTNANGIVEFFYDGLWVGNITGEQIVSKANQFVKMSISTSFGGSNYAQVGTKDQYLYYDDFVVWEGAGGSYPARGVPSKVGRNITQSMPTACEVNKGRSVALNVCGIGNSIMKVPYDWLNSKTGYYVTNIANAGDRISKQEIAWDALSSEEKSSFDYVVMQIGINDIVQDDTYATIQSAYQSLFAAVNGDISAGCEVIVFTTTPWKGHNLWTTIKQTKQDQLNTWILTTQSGVDLSTDTSRDNLKDPVDTKVLYVPYSHGDYIHPNDIGRQIIVDNIIQAIQSLE